MFEQSIRNIFILMTSFYTFYKLLNFKPQDIWSQIILILSSSIIGISNSLLFHKIQSLSWVIIFFELFLIMLVSEKQNLFITYTATTFSYALSFISFCISIIVSSMIISLFYFGKYDIPWFIIQTFIGIMQLGIIHFCFRISRLRKGMNFVYNIHSGNIGSILCIIVIILSLIFAHLDSITNIIIHYFFLFMIVLSFLFIYWWNYHITQTYRKFLKKNEIDSLMFLLEERNQEILYLKSENDKLARLIHKDNKLIPAISNAIFDSYENGISIDFPDLETDSSLYAKLKQLYNERVDALETYEKKTPILPQTAFDSINATLSFMHSEALKSHIPYQIVLFDNLASTIPNEITEDDFNHLLSELLSNALNACKDTPSASIQIYLGKTDGISTIKISNTGKIFAIETLKNLGIARHTTHANDGGSGIGLMDIWKIKQKYAATLLIDETIDTENESAHTSVNILFNHKNHYILQSDRHKELGKNLNRPDIMIISKE